MPPVRSASSAIFSATTAYTSLTFSFSALTLSVSEDSKEVRSELSPVPAPSTWKRLATYSPESSTTLMA